MFDDERVFGRCRLLDLKTGRSPRKLTWPRLLANKEIAMALVTYT